MIRAVAIAWLVLIAGCSLAFLSPDDQVNDDDYVPFPDARPRPIDAARFPDAPYPWCTGGPYDWCFDTVNSTDCGPDLLCHEFPALGITVCTPTCNPEYPCPPQQNGNPVTCNAIGLCRPTMANSCPL